MRVTCEEDLVLRSSFGRSKKVSAANDLIAVQNHRYEKVWFEQNGLVGSKICLKRMVVSGTRCAQCANWHLATDSSWLVAAFNPSSQPIRWALIDRIRCAAGGCFLFDWRKPNHLHAGVASSATFPLNDFQLHNQKLRDLREIFIITARWTLLYISHQRWAKNSKNCVNC